MNRYFFILGRYYSLSLAEILSQLKKEKIEFLIEEIGPEAVIINLPEIFDTGYFMDRLGGTVEMGRIISQLSLDEDRAALYSCFESDFLTKYFIPEKTKKIHFGISIYDAGAKSNKLIKLLENHLSDFNNNIKENLKINGFKSGYLRLKGRKLSSVAVYKNRLLDRGFEMCLHAAGDNIYVGRTEKVQDYSSYAYRDIKRPALDKKAGILPVKLARTLINLSGIGAEERLLDPFCGSGTILMEAVLSGIKNITGSDISEYAINSSRQNLDWLFKSYSLDKKSFQITLRTSDVRLLDKQLKGDVFDALVTEPFLGPPLLKRPADAVIKKSVNIVTSLYHDSFSVFRKLLKKEGRLVIVFPVYHSADEDIFIDASIIAAGGFRIINPLSEASIGKIKSWLTKRQSVLYTSPGQFIGREIYLLQPV